MFSKVCGWIISGASAVFMTGMAVLIGVEAKKSIDDYRSEKEFRKEKMVTLHQSGGDD